jgi:hypothetical protein
MPPDDTPTTRSNGAADPRRALPIALGWNSDGTIGRITINGEYWAAVEWSEQRQCWCIEDAEGECLAHASHIRGQAASKNAVVALAREMIRDGRMPAPDELAREARARREKRRQQPAQIRNRDERRRLNQSWSDAYTAKWEAERADKAELPLLEALAEAFDFAHPELWKSNSWAAMRPRLIVHQRAVVAGLESDLAYEIKRANTEPFTMHASKEDRRQRREARQVWGNRQAREIEAKLSRARVVLAALEGCGLTEVAAAAPRL